MADPDASLRKHLIVEGLAGLAMLLAAFALIALTDVTATGTRLWWSLLVGGFAVLTFAADRLYSGHGLADTQSAVRIALHWLGVFLALHLAFYFVASGRMANANAGLMNGLILALGTYLAGVAVNWRLIVIGVALGLATVVVAFTERYLWVLLGLAVLTIIVLLVTSRLMRRTPR